jgi:uncharacterized protein (TIGR03437 family)
MHAISVAFVLLAGAGTVLAQPVINQGGVRNAAAARYGLLMNGNVVARGSLILISGARLGPDAPVRASAGTLPTSLGGTSVSISVDGQRFDAPLLYVVAGEIAAVVPSVTPAGSGSVTVARESLASEPSPVSVVPASFGAFTLSAASAGDSVFSRFQSQSSMNMNELSGYAKPGQEVTLWGTGLGAISVSDADVPPGEEIATAVEVYVDQKPARVIYKGRAGCCQGLDRITFEIPSDVQGCSLPVAVKAGDLLNLVSTVSVSNDEGFCPSENGFSTADIDKARAQGNLKVGTIYLMRYGDVTTGQAFDMGYAGFSRISYDRIRQFQPALQHSIPGACYAWNVNSNGSSSQTSNTNAFPGADFFNSIYPFGEEALDAGSTLTMSGPGGQQQMTAVTPGVYTWMYYDSMITGQAFLKPGTYTLDNGGGGRDVSAFRASLDIADPVTWTGLKDLTKASRSSDLTLPGQGADVPTGYGCMRVP